MRVGGHAGAVRPPAELLSRPADAFVAGFVGRDRGYRALGFAAAGDLPVQDEPVLTLGGDLARAATLAENGWVLVVDRDGAPQGWLSVTGLPAARLTGTVEPGLLNLGGTLAAETGTLREALDAALSSPSGRGVVVHEDGSFAGTISASQVLELIEARATQLRNAAQTGATP